MKRRVLSQNQSATNNSKQRVRYLECLICKVGVAQI